jgi:hypothetical protein
MLCPTCDNYWSCSADGYCEAGCGPVPEESQKCLACPTLQCGDLEQGVDSDGDGCVDACIPANCETDDECAADGYFCLKPAQSCDGFGKCAPKEACDTTDAVEVCGCDGVTYGSSCKAQAAGVNVASYGPCATTPDAP